MGYPLRVGNEMKTMTARGIPEDVLRAFRAWCSRRGYTLNKGIIEAMKLQAAPFMDQVVGDDSRD